MYEQLDIFSMMNTEEKPIKEKPKRLNVGDKIGRLDLGDVVIATITEVEGNEEHFFYRTDRGCCFEATDRTDLEQMEREAEEIRKHYDIVVIDKLEKFFAVKYPPRACDGHILYAMVGTYNGMLFWKEDVTYQFLEKVKDLEKEFNKRVEKITHYFDGKDREYELLKEPIPIKRLYYSKCADLYAEAGYVKCNP